MSCTILMLANQNKIRCRTEQNRIYRALVSIKYTQARDNIQDKDYKKKRRKTYLKKHSTYTIQ